MNEEPTLKVKDWKKFQHFKDRTPPWIKLYRDILDDPDWHALSPECSKTLVMLWLIASEDPLKEGHLPCIRKLCFRLRLKENDLRKQIDSLSHWLGQDDINAISTRCRRDAPETETETEGETETDILLGAVPASEPPADDPVYLTYPTVGKVREWHLHKSRLDEYWKLYSKALDVLGECQKARLWLVDNPSRRKTPKGMPRFLTNWMDRACNKGGLKPLSIKQAKAEAEQLRKAQVAKRRNGTEHPMSVAAIVNQVTEQNGKA